MTISSMQSKSGRYLSGSMAFLSVLLGVCLGSAFAAEPVVMNVGTVRGEPGATVYVPVTLTTAGNSVSTITLSLAYDSARLTFDEDVDAADMMGAVAEAADKMLSFANYAGEGTLNLVLTGGVTPIGDGALMALPFIIDADAPIGVVPIRRKGASAASPSGTGLDVRVGEGQVVIGGAAAIQVTPNPASLDVGATTTLEAASSDPDDTSFNWVSSDEDVATVSNSGVVRGVAAGTVSISATGNHSGVTGSAAVDVVYSSSITVSPSLAMVVVGQQAPMTASSTDAGDTSFTWGTTNPAVAVVTSSGGASATVQGVGVGSAHITATGNASGLQGAAAVVVTIEAAVSIQPNAATVLVGQSVPLSAVSTDLLDAFFDWESSDPSIASVSDDGLVTGWVPGTVTITATGGSSGNRDQAQVTVNCAYVAAPENVRASEGARTDGVLVQWDAVPGLNVEYRVYRALLDQELLAEPVGSGWQTATQFLDTGAEVPTPMPAGCLGRQAVLAIHYYYWVQARSGVPCEGGMSASSEGYRGGAKSVQAVVLPDTVDEQGQRWARHDAALAVRLQSDMPIDPDSVWGTVACGAFRSESIEWQLVLDRDNDGWVVYRPGQLWMPGDVVEMTAGALTVSGDFVGPVSYSLEIRADAAKDGAAIPIAQPHYADIDTRGMDLSVEAADEAIVTVSPEPLPELAGGAGPAYTVGGGAVFAVPQRVWLPVPDDVVPESLSVWYCHESGWYRAEEVDGWLVPDSLLSVHVDGVTWLGFVAQHAGTVRLGSADAGAFLGASSAGSMGDMLTLMAVLTVLGAISLSRKRACAAGGAANSGEWRS